MKDGIKKGKRHISRDFVIVAAAGLLAACATDTMTYDGSSKVARNEVRLVRIAHEVEAGADGALIPKDRATLDRFFADMGLGYGDSVSMLEGPAFSEEARASVTTAVHAWGVPISGPPAEVDRSPANNAAFVIVDRYVVTPPDCPNSTLNLSRNYANAPSPQYGCAMVINLGQMVADPRDLLAGKSGALPVTEKATQAIRMWREDEPEFAEPVNIDSGATEFTSEGGS